jgi:hypothetical protein
MGGHTGFPLANKRGPRLRGDHVQIKEIERDDDSKNRHPALALLWQIYLRRCFSRIRRLQYGHR